MPAGLTEFLAALGIVALVTVLILCARSCSWGKDDSETDGTSSVDTSAAVNAAPPATVLTPVPAEDISYPFPVTAGITLDRIYTATGYFPEDGSDEAIDNVLAVKLTNISEKTLEYLSFSLTLNGEICKFTAATVPAGKSVYAFSTERSTAPESISSIESDVEFVLYFTEEPSAKTDNLSYDVQNGTIVVTNISERDISSDIVVYYKAKAEDGYLGGITYRFRISGGLAAGERFNAYAPHAYGQKTEIMFAQYEE